MYDPQSLSPKERKTMATRLGLDGTPLEPIINITTNPLVLVGLGMSLMFPIPNARQLTSFMGKVGKLPKRWEWSKFISPVSENYRRTPVPKLLQAMFLRRNTFSNKLNKEWTVAIRKYQKATGKSFPTEQEERVVAALMDRLDDPENPTWRRMRTWLEEHAAGHEMGDIASRLKDPLPQLRNPKYKHLRQLAEDSRKVFKTAWDEVLKDPDNQKRIRTILAEKWGIRATNAEELREILDYWPHARSMAPETEWLERTEFWAKHTKSSVRRKMGAGQAARQATKQAADRTSKMLPSPKDLAALGASDDLLHAVNVVDKRYVYSFADSGVDAAATALTKTGLNPGTPLYYSLEYGRGVQKYIDDIAKVNAFSIPPIKVVGGKRMDSLGKRLQAEIRRMAGSGEPHEQVMANILDDTIVPQVLGNMSDSQAQWTLKWASQKSKAMDILNAERVKKVLPTGMHKAMTRWLRDDPGSSLPGFGAGISKHFYTATLGFPNPIPSLLNLLQPIATTLPLGTKYMVKGYKEGFQQFGKYIELRAKGLPFEDAIEQAMPRFFKANLELDPRAAEFIRESMEAMAQKAIVGKKLGWVGSMQNKLLSMFSHSEMFNRLVAYEAAYAKGLTEIPGKKWYSVLEDVTKTVPKKGPGMLDAVSEFATEMTYMTQYGGGPLQRPMGTLNWWSPLAQFSTFPSRTASLLIGPMMRHPGYGGRAALAAGLAYGTGRELWDTDVSRGLLFGGLPEPTGFGPFPTLPVVPPFLQVSGALAMSLATGESEHIRRSLPLLVPGGVGLARGIGFTGLPGAEPVAKTIEKKYADYSARTPDGRVPVYTPNGMLVSYDRPLDLMTRAFGVGDVSGQKEVETSRWLLRQREVVREMKREALEALYHNDPQEFLKLQERFVKRYPGMGNIPIRKSDIRSLHLRKDVTRLEKTLETLPPEMRDEMTALMATTFGAGWHEMLGLQQQIRGDQTISTREPYRRRPISGTRERVSKGLHGVKLRDKLGLRGADKLGREPEGTYFGTSGWFPDASPYGP